MLDSGDGPVVTVPLMPDSWVTSDHHFGHRNIARYQGRPADHEELMVERWHALVAPDDVVLHLGDLLVFPGASELACYADLLRALPGRKHLIIGSHDQRSRRWYADAGFEVVRSPLLWGGAVFTHEPYVGYHLPWVVNVHGHVHRNRSPAAPPGRRRFNACVEVTGYAPVRLGDAVVTAV